MTWSWDLLTDAGDLNGARGQLLDVLNTAASAHEVALAKVSLAPWIKVEAWSA